MSRLKLAALGLTALLTVVAGVATIADSQEARAAAQPNTVTGTDYRGSSFKLTGWSFTPNLHLVDGGSRTYGPGELQLTATVVGSVDRVELHPGWSGQIVRDGKKSATVILTNERSIVLSSKVVDDEAHRFDFFLAFNVYGDLPLDASRTITSNRAEVLMVADILPVTAESGPLGGAAVIR